MPSRLLWIHHFLFLCWHSTIIACDPVCSVLLLLFLPPSCELLVIEGREGVWLICICHMASLIVTQWQFFITVTICSIRYLINKALPPLESWATLILFLQAVPLEEQDPYHKLLFFILWKANAILLPNVPLDGLIAVNIISSFLWQKLWFQKSTIFVVLSQHDNPPQSGGLSHWAYVPILQMLKWSSIVTSKRYWG